MKFNLYTLVDITETRARKGEEPKLMRQQQNFLTVLQTIGLRVNPSYIESPKIIKETPNKLGLGSTYKTKQNVWEFSFDIEYEGALSVEMLTNDFNLIPVITNLNETVEFENATFITKNKDINNIVFVENDK